MSISKYSTGKVYSSSVSENFSIALSVATTASRPVEESIKFTPLVSVRNWFDNIKVKNAKFAHTLCRIIPAQCPFERDVKLGGRTILHIPPMCKLNPFYDELVALRFRALCYLADECGEDVSIYC